MENNLTDERTELRILYSFPYAIGSNRVCHTAWNQANGLAQNGAIVHAICGSFKLPLPQCKTSKSTLCIGKLRIPIKAIGKRAALAIHDRRTATWLKRNHHEIDLVHCWPTASLKTLTLAKQLRIPTFYERPNPHTEYAFEAADTENEYLKISLPKGHHHKRNNFTISRENQEYELTDFLLCPSDFVKQSYLDREFPEDKLARHQYGCNAERFTPNLSFPPNKNRPLKVLFASYCEPRKGLHYALEAWINSTASKDGEFLICGQFVEAYRTRLADLLKHKSVKILGHRNDLEEVMKNCDIFTLPSVEEGSALVTYEAAGTGCVLLVSDAAGAQCIHMENGLIHEKRDTQTLTSHFNLLHSDRELLGKLRSNTVENRRKLTWDHAAKTLLTQYKVCMTRHKN